jgi:hypothetical protein
MVARITVRAGVGEILEVIEALAEVGETLVVMEVVMVGEAVIEVVVVSLMVAARGVVGWSLGTVRVEGSGGKSQCRWSCPCRHPY